MSNFKPRSQTTIATKTPTTPTTPTTPKGGAATPTTPVAMPEWHKGDAVFMNHPTESWIPGDVVDIEVTKKDTKYVCVPRDSNVTVNQITL
jgi:hypothetical protein